MLNWVWLALLSLGILAAVSMDITDTAVNKYRNGRYLEAEVYAEEKLEPGKPYDLKVKVSREKFNSFYDAAYDTTITFTAKITPNKDSETAAVYFRLDENFPELWREMAAVNGEEDDLSGKMKLPQYGPGAISVEMKLEEVSFKQLKGVTNAALDYAETSVNIALGLIGIMAMWLGIMKIAEEAGIINYIAAALRPVTRFLFPDVPHDHPAIGSMIMNVSATFLGLGNAATPFGIKAMEDLQKLNKDKETATNAMCTFLVINTASFALIPATAVALRAASGSSQPAIIIGTTMFGSFCATIVGITATKFFEKFPLHFTNFFPWLRKRMKRILIILGLAALITLLVITGAMSQIGSLFSWLTPEALTGVVRVISTVAIPFVILLFVTLGAIKKVKVYETFVEGAKEGFEIAVTIIPYLVAMLVAIGIFRAGGAMEWLVFVLRPVTDFVGMPVEALPMALMRPLSGSGSLGVMAEIFAVHGPDSFIGIMVSTFFGSTETTFYVLAVYFGAVNIKNTRHALPAGLISDIAGILAAIFIVRLMFG